MFQATEGINYAKKTNIPSPFPPLENDYGMIDSHNHLKDDIQKNVTYYVRR